MRAGEAQQSLAAGAWLSLAGPRGCACAGGGATAVATAVLLLLLLLATVTGAPLASTRLLRRASAHQLGLFFSHPLRPPTLSLSTSIRPCQAPTTWT